MRFTVFSLLKTFDTLMIDRLFHFGKQIHLNNPFLLYELKMMLLFGNPKDNITCVL